MNKTSLQCLDWFKAFKNKITVHLVNIYSCFNSTHHLPETMSLVDIFLILKSYKLLSLLNVNEKVLGKLLTLKFESLMPILANPIRFNYRNYMKLTGS